MKFLKPNNDELTQITSINKQIFHNTPPLNLRIRQCILGTRVFGEPPFFFFFFWWFVNVWYFLFSSMNKFKTKINICRIHLKGFQFHQFNLQLIYMQIDLYVQAITFIFCKCFHKNVMPVQRKYPLNCYL